MLAVSRILAKTLFIASAIFPGWALADVNTCFNFISSQDYARAENEAKELLNSGKLERVYERSAQLCLGRAYASTGRAQDALPAFQRVEALSQTTQELAIAYNWLGTTYYNLGDLDRAELYSQRALKGSRELGDKKSEAATLNNLAMIVRHRGDTERALALYRESLAMKPEAEQHTTLNNIALIHLQRKEYPQAIAIFRQAIAIARSNGDAHGSAMYQINLGYTLKETKKFAEAEQELLSGLNTARLLGDKSWEATACEHLGWLANDNPQKNVDEIRQWLSQAEALYREIGNIAQADSIAKLLAGN